MVHETSAPQQAAPDAARMGKMVAVARLYHEQGRSQAEIAELLALSQPSVSRLLTDAERWGIVRRTVIEPSGTYSVIEEELRQRLGLREVVVAYSEPGARDANLASMGAAGAAYLAASIRPDERIGVSSRSAAVSAMVESMPLLDRAASSVVQTFGAIGTAPERARATRLTERLAQSTGAEPVYLPAPGVVVSEVVRNGLLHDPCVADAVAAWSTLTTLLTGIGNPTLPGSDESDARQVLFDAGAVGDIAFNGFDREGDPVAHALRQRIIGIGPDELKAVPRRVAVAGGLAKVEAIHAAARGGWITVLVTDETTARALLAVPAS